jgi:predicted nucleotidyltransferase
MKRERATALLIEMLRRIDTGGCWQLDMIHELYLFGSYARGAIQPGDVDVIVEFDHQREEWKEHFLSSFSYGRDPHATLRVALRGRARSLSLVFGRERHEDIPMILLWRRGEPVDAAIARIHAIAPDSTATRADRDAMPGYLRVHGDKLPRYLRRELVALVDDGVLEVSEIVLPDREPSAAWCENEVIRFRWSDGSPLRRAAHAVLAHWEGHGVDLAQIRLHGAAVDVDTPSTPYSAGFGLRYFGQARWCFVEEGGTEWIEIVTPTGRGPIDAIMLCRGRSFATAGWPWSDGSYFS